jgi:glutamate:GABA antiporter
MANNTLKNKKMLGIFAVTMINVVAVDSLRTLPFSAAYGLSLVFYYVLAALLFFLPIALISAELATGWPNKGGIYVWVREAFGERWGFVVIWLQWVYNIVWYPTILAFIAGTLAYLIDPALADNKIFMLSVILTTLWAATLLNFFSIRVSSVVSSVGALVGTLIPMVFIMLLGAIWIAVGRPIQIHFSVNQLLPDVTHFDNLSFLLAVLFGLVGMEVSASHADEVDRPEYVYPRAILFSTVIIFFSLVLSSLAIAMVVPQHSLNVVTGLTQAFGIFFESYYMSWMLPVISFLMIIGGIGGVATWLIGPTKGLLVAARDGSVPPIFGKVNRHGSPVSILLLQAIICTVLCSVFLLMPSVSSSYWLLTAMTAQLAMLVYVILFAAAIYLRYKHPQVKRAYTVPGGKPGMWLLGVTGIIASLGAISLGFVPPAQINVGEVARYETLLIAGIVAFCLPPFLIYNYKKAAWKDNAPMAQDDELALEQMQ